MRYIIFVFVMFINYNGYSSDEFMSLEEAFGNSIVGMHNFSVNSNSTVSFVNPDRKIVVIDKDYNFSIPYTIETIFDPKDNKLLQYGPTFVQTNGRIWIAGNKLMYLKKDSLKIFDGNLDDPESDYEIYRFAEDSIGNVWYTIRGKALYKINNGNPEDGIECFELPVEVNELDILTLHITSDNKVLIVGTYGVLLQFDGIDWDIVDLTPIEGLFELNIIFDHSVLDQNDALWLSPRKGLLKYSDKEFTYYSPEEYNFNYDQLSAICFDNKGNLWISFYINNVEDRSKPLIGRFDGEKVEYLPLTSEYSFSNMYIDKNQNFWLSQYQKIYLYRPGGVLLSVPEELEAETSNGGVKPNPFDNQTVVAYEVAEPGDCDVALYDGLGNKLMSLASGWHEAGSYEAEIDGTELSPGMYYVVIRTATGIETKKAVVVR